MITDHVCTATCEGTAAPFEYPTGQSPELLALYTKDQAHASTFDMQMHPVPPIPKDA